MIQNPFYATIRAMNILVVTHTTPNTPSKDGMSLILYHIQPYLEKDHVLTFLCADQFENTSDFLKTIREHTDTHDVVYLHGPEVLNILPNLSAIHTVVVGLIDTQSYKYQQLAEAEVSTIQKRKWKKQQAYWEQFEQQELSNVNQIIVGSDADRDALMKHMSGKPYVSVIANGVDSGYFSPDAEIAKEHAIIFSGVLDQATHVQSITHFAKNIWPLITKAAEHYTPKWYIVGKQPPKKILQLQKKDERIIVTGFVPEVRDFLIRSKVFVSPIHLRSGIRNTVLEALACGLPVVAFADACRGLEASPIRKVHTDSDFANTVNHLLNEPDQLADVGHASRKYVQLHHNWEQQAKKYEQILEQVSHN